MNQSGRENRLSRETSPYLLQHARNPVDWYPWGSEALKKARTEDKPILLSIGYSACHWCHVMERESFEDEATARLMNEHFVCIKVDREERPDLDLIYMNAVQIMTGSGGWPLNVFLTPSLKPFYGGTYFPPESRHGMPAFQAVLTRVAQAYREQRDKVAASSDQITGYIEKMSQVAPSEESLTDDLQLAALAQFKANFDARHGGWGSPPKFPQAHAISLLFRIHRRLGDREARSSAELTLEKMARGGMYDQLGGGFHRYSTDAHWLVPHFEKMLYDQALLVPAYLEGYQLSRRELFARVARECLDYVAREMTSQEGGFFSAQDADSEGVEGKFFVWTLEEIREVAGEPDARYFGASYDVTEAGNWEGRSILNVPRDLPEVARELGITHEELDRSLSRSRQKLLERRQKRVRPGLDDKILMAWNGLMISAFARGYQVLGEPRYLESARCAARFLLTKMRGEDGSLRRTYRQGVAKLGGCLDDYAFLAAGLLDLYESDFDPNWFEEVRVLLDGMVRNFWDERNGAFFFTATDERDLIVRSKTGHDGALPSGNSVASLLLLRMARLTGASREGEKALRILRAYREPMGSMPAGFAQMLCSLDFHLDEPKEVALVGEGNDREFQELLRVVRGEFLPNKVLAATKVDGSRAKNGKPVVELLAGKKSVGGKPTAYVCRDFQCRKPTCDPEELKGLLVGRSPKRRRKG